MSRSSYILNATSVDGSRSSWVMSKSHKTSLPFGKVVPLGKPVKILPGDTFRLDLGAVIRSLTPKAPLMDSISGDIYAYFVPYRLIYDRAKQFFGQNEDEAWTLNLTHQLPHIVFSTAKNNYAANGSTGFYYKINGDYDFRGSLLDHFETPFVYLNTEQYNSLPSSSDPNISINALPFRGYQLIWNEDFRNPSVVDPDLYLNYDHSDKTVNTATLYSICQLKPVMRYRDLYSSALKAPQRGPSVNLPIAGLAPIIASDELHLTRGNVLFGSTSDDKTALGIDEGAMTANTYNAATSNIVNKTNLVAYLPGASGATVNLVRQSIALQHLYEMMTNAFRYQEYTEVFFGVRGSDSTLQRPQHLGGIHFRFNINEVISTAQTSDANLGQTGAFGTAEIKGHVYTQSFTEHGYIYLICVLRKEHTYVQGLDKLWRDREFLDEYQPPLAHIGNVDIPTSEVYFMLNESGAILDDAFGYTEPNYDLRYEISKSCCLMNPMAPNSLSFYSLTDVLSGRPYLNKTFVSEDPNGLDNALIASASFVDQFYADFYFRYHVTRKMPLYSVPGLNRI